MKKLKTKAALLLLMFALVIFFFNLGDFNLPKNFEGRFYWCLIIGTILSLMIIPFLGRHKIYPVRSLFRILIVIGFFIISLKINEIYGPKESIILSMAIFLPSLFLSFLNKNKPKKKISEN